MAGIGNLFLGDDGWGPEVVRRLAAEARPEDGVRLVDHGIRGLHLAYDLLDHAGALVIVDAVPGPGPAGTVSVREVGPEHLAAGRVDAHGMDPVAVLGSLEQLGGRLPPTWVVGCVPADLEEGIGLSAAVAAAVETGADAVRGLVARLVAVSA